MLEIVDIRNYYIVYRLTLVYNRERMNENFIFLRVINLYNYNFEGENRLIYTYQNTGWF